jgi:endogenous inhibitor of DNA gyrase (YacG/DUF329 family)
VNEVGDASTEGPARIVRCPTCGKGVKWTPGNAFRPFCSERCRVIDLGAWASGEHRIPGEPEEDDLLSEDPERE